MGKTDFEKAKKIIQTKTFCFMEWQVKDAEQRNDKVMEKEDIEFLLALEMPKQKLLHHDMKKYDSAGLFLAIEKARDNQMDGVVVLMSNIINDDVLKIVDMGYFVEFIGPGDLGDVIYFTEDALIRNRIFDVKKLFGDLALALSKNII